MPELPDIELYVSKLREKLCASQLTSFKILNPFVLRSVSPAPKDFFNSAVTGISRIGKRVVIEFDDELFIVIHLMIAGRLRWIEPFDKFPGGKIVSAIIGFESPFNPEKNGELLLTEAGSKKRASICLVRGRTNLKQHDPGGMEVLQSTLQQFSNALLKENHTVKRALTTSTIFSGIGNAYSDEILFAAKLPPTRLIAKLTEQDVGRLYQATRQVLQEWTERLQNQFKDRFPGAGDITAFRPEFNVHGKFGKPCPVCNQPVKRIRYADNEANYCAVCQNNGKELADRAMSRLLK